jgi:hypothetical protein
MPIIVELYDLKRVGSFILPDACPHCKATFLGEESCLREWEFQDVGDLRRIDKENGMTVNTSGPSPKYGDVHETTSYWCTNCDKELTLRRAARPKEMKR